MALDLTRIALDANAPVDFATAYWQSLVTAAIPPYLRALAWTETRLGGLPAARSGAQAEFVTHPLWSVSHPAVLGAHGEAANMGITDSQAKTLFELVRRPF